MKEELIVNAVRNTIKDYDLSYAILTVIQKDDEKYDKAIEIISNFISYNLELIKSDDIFLSDAVQHSFMYILGVCIPFNTAENMAKNIMNTLLNEGEVK